MSEPLRIYEVTQQGHTTRMQLNETDAKAYGDAAVLVEDAGTGQDADTGQAATTDERTGSTDLKARSDVHNKARGTNSK